MGTNSLIDRLKQVMDSDAEIDERNRRKALKKILKKLKVKQEHLKEKLADATGEERDRLSQKIDMVKAHRKKAISSMKAIKNSS